jgi:hypothetical protein
MPEQRGIRGDAAGEPKLDQSGQSGRSDQQGRIGIGMAREQTKADETHQCNPT